MKNLLFLIATCLLINVSALAQDTIVLLNGENIKAQVIEIGTTEIKYKKYDNRETSPVYSVFKNKVSKIKYTDGTEDVFQTEAEKKPLINNKIFAKKTEPAKTDNVPEKQGYMTKYYVGGGFSLLNNYRIGNLNDFWQRINGSDRAIGKATGLFVIKLGMNSSLDQYSTNWFGAEMQFVFTPSHALWGTSLFYGGRNEVQYKAFLMNIAMTYSRAIDNNKQAFVVVEPGLDIATMKGSITIDNNYYMQAFTIGLGGHVATGLDYVISKNFIVNTRLGYRFVGVPEMHENPASSTGYSSFYVNGQSGETVKVSWSGMFMTAGASLSISSKGRTY